MVFASDAPFDVDNEVTGRHRNTTQHHAAHAAQASRSGGGFLEYTDSDRESKGMAYERPDADVIECWPWRLRGYGRCRWPRSGNPGLRR